MTTLFLKTFIVLTTLLVCATAPTWADDHTVRLTDQTVVRFATQRETKQLLKRKDRFVIRLSTIDRRIRLKSASDVSQSDFLDYVSRQGLDWEAAEIDVLKKKLESIRQRIEELRLTIPWPDTVLLSKTTGLEEAGAPHCRGAAIVLPRRSVSDRRASLERLLIHELFHVLSSHDPKLRSRMYEIIGFDQTNEIDLPPALKSRKLTNPDAPSVDCVIKIQMDDTDIYATPVLFTKRDHYDSLADTTVFRELEFRLLIVEKQNGDWKYVTENGMPILIQPEECPSFHAQIGRNTRYIIHPEEVLADNFVHLLMQTDELPDRWIIDQLRKLLMQSSST